LSDQPRRPATPDLTTDSGRIAFNRLLNDRLPTKRAIAQGLLRNERGEVLLCELTYKKDWDLPGGVLDPRESPRECVAREIAEELDVDVHPSTLLAVNWLPPYRGWDDAILFLFDLGTVEARRTRKMSLLKREIREVHWVSVDDLDEHVAPYTAAMVRHVLDGPLGAGTTVYLEDSAPVDS
jgi:8-oxo-dGTP pyrophosphatase MutT (NUDIX family)